MENIIFTEISGKGGNIGVITLNRPKAINAMTTEMCRLMHQKLNQWAVEKNIKAVVIKGNGDKGFCAGGDIRHFYEMGHKGLQASIDFFWEEYRLNYAIFNFPKPYIALIHGITMGGGVGVSIHGSHRIAANDLVWAMPETGIGFYPDIGSSYFLPRLLDKTGIYLGLTGTKISVNDAHYMGIVDSLIDRDQFDEVINALANTEFSTDAHASVNDVVDQFIRKPEPSALVAHRVAIDRYFSKHSIEEILESLRQENIPWTQDTVDILLSKSPTSLKVTLEQLKRGASLDDFGKCMQMEFRLSNHFLNNKDFYEGIRAALIDKDRNPQWNPASLNEVQNIGTYFAPVEKELIFD